MHFDHNIPSITEYFANCLFAFDFRSESSLVLDLDLDISHTPVNRCNSVFLCNLATYFVRQGFKLNNVLGVKGMYKSDLVEESQLLGKFIRCKQLLKLGK